MRHERGFTLLEATVALGIAALLLAAGGVWMLGRHPGTLAQTLVDYDAALDNARAVAAAEQGATLVFAPRAKSSRSASGFTLRVYRGRPAPGVAVSTTTAMPLESAASISERTLGRPPFAIFMGASGHVSGAPAYPRMTGDGTPVFTEIAREPACPSGGFVLQFSTPQAQQTRTLPCSVTPPALPGPSNPSPTPNRPLVTPRSMLYHWPADAGQTFTATEWGYTHWFAATGGFECGSGAARFPDVLPSPYTPADSPLESLASPSPPPMTPYSLSKRLWRQHQRRTRGISAQSGGRRRLHRNDRRRLRSDRECGRARDGVADGHVCRQCLHASLEIRTQPSVIGLSR